MIKCALICHFGASTGMLADKIRAYGATQGLDIEVQAYPEDDLGSVINDYEVFLFGPQLLYKMSVFRETYPDKAEKFVEISPIDFGRMNAEKLVGDIKTKLGK